ncbi:MAG: hypothetical protein JW765_11430 [Deltaproteobacteria bacterium]|nr:hypothetical protein [Candidatus Zymogenaceae bacterium]
MISGKKLIKIGWYMLSVPLIVLFLSIIVSVIVSGSDNAVNPVVRLVGIALVFFWALSLFPLVIGLIKIIAEAITRKREGAK